MKFRSVHVNDAREHFDCVNQKLCGCGIEMRLKSTRVLLNTRSARKKKKKNKKNLCDIKSNVEIDAY